MAATLTLDIPSWLEWARSLELLHEHSRVPGEVVDLSGQTVVWCTMHGCSPVTVGVTAVAGALQIETNGEEDVVVETVLRRFHLGADAADIEAALDRTQLGLRAEELVRRPAAVSTWDYCLMYLCGGDPDATATTQLFTALGTVGQEGNVRTAPRPAAVLRAGESGLRQFGIKPGRVVQLLALAAVFTERQGEYDAAVLRTLDADEAVDRIAELPHIGAKRARELTSTAVGHDDVTYEPWGVAAALEDQQGMPWRAATERLDQAAPWRSWACDTLADQTDTG